MQILNILRFFVLKNEINADLANTTTMPTFTANRAVVSDGSGELAVSAVTSTQLGFLSGAKSNIQTQINNKASKVELNNKSMLKTIDGNHSVSFRWRADAGDLYFDILIDGIAVAIIKGDSVLG